MNNTYSTIASVAKKVARDEARTNAVLKRQGKLAGLKTHFDEVVAMITADIKSLKDGIVIAQNDMLDTRENDPRLKSRTEHFELVEKHNTEEIASAEKELVEVEKQYKKDVTEQEDGIAKLVSGETKMSLEFINTRAAELIRAKHGAIFDEMTEADMEDVVA